MGGEKLRDIVVEERQPGGAEALSVGGEIEFTAHDGGFDLGGAVTAVAETLYNRI